MHSTPETAFGPSRVQDYDTLIEPAQEFGSYQVTGTGSGPKILHVVTVSSEDVINPDAVQQPGRPLPARTFPFDRLRASGSLAVVPEGLQQPHTRPWPVSGQTRRLLRS